MIEFKNVNGELIRISPDDGFHYFFGYYDIPGFSGDDKLHLCHRVKFMNRMQHNTDIAEVGVIDIATKKFTKVGETRAWNFQQGALLQWYPKGSSEQILYNAYSEELGYHAIVQNLNGDVIKTICKPLANVSENGKYGVSVNFSRIFDFRPGYGYCNTVDPLYNIPQPEDDGIFLVDLEKNESKMIASYKGLAEIYCTDEPYKDNKLCVNHITFNKTSDRILFLLRNFTNKGVMWKTALGTTDLEGNIYKLHEFGQASHYHWRDGETILFYSTPGEEKVLCELKDLTQDYKVYSKEYFSQDIHGSYSPNLKYIIGDNYQDKENYRKILFLNIATNKLINVGEFYSCVPPCPDVRCDLHVLWNNAGDKVSFDSTHEGFRGLYILDIKNILMMEENQSTLSQYI